MSFMDLKVLNSQDSFTMAIKETVISISSILIKTHNEFLNIS